MWCAPSGAGQGSVRLRRDRCKRMYPKSYSRVVEKPLAPPLLTPSATLSAKRLAPPDDLISGDQQFQRSVVDLLLGDSPGVDGCADVSDQRGGIDSIGGR